MGYLPIGLCVISLFGLFFLGKSLNQFGQNWSGLFRLIGEKRVRLILIGLSSVPLLTLLGLALLFVLDYREDQPARWAHGLFILGLWFVLTFSFILLVSITRLGNRPAFPTLAAPVLVVPLVAYLTPFWRFKETFAGGTFPWAGMTGMILVVVCYVYLSVVWREWIDHQRQEVPRESNRVHTP